MISKLVTAKRAYDAFAPVYDAFNHNYQYESWTARLQEAAENTGLGRGRRLLDVACGTGLSFLPLLDQGWTVTGCDVSPAMLAAAAEKVESRADAESVELLIADMRELPWVHSSFDLVWSVNDSLNYLLSVNDLSRALSGMARAVGSAGRIVFDVNTVLLYNTFFGRDHDVPTSAGLMRWRGLTPHHKVKEGAIIEARLEALNGRGNIHQQRHFPLSDVMLAIDRAELDCLAVLGERDGLLNPGLNEDENTKAVYVCAPAGAAQVADAGRSEEAVRA
jgi:SAM-dependent methyltransferase